MLFAVNPLAQGRRSAVNNHSGPAACTTREKGLAEAWSVTSVLQPTNLEPKGEA